MTANRLARKNRGGGHSYTIDGEPCAGVTTIIDGGVPKPALTGWAARVTAGYALDHWDDLAELTPSKRLRELERAQYTERNAAAARGTKVHAYAAQLAGGDDVTIPDDVLPLVDAYLTFVADYHVHEFAVEAPVAHFGNDPLHRDRYAGTLDLLAHIDDRKTLTIIDWKTGGSGVWPEVALQLAAYAHADVIHVNGVEAPMPAVHDALAVWLRADGYDVYPVDIGDATFRTFQYAQQVALFTSAERGRYIGEALVTPADEAVAS